VFAVSPPSGVSELIAGRGAAAVIARRLLPAAIVVPVLFGWARLLGQKAGYYETEFGLVIMAVAASMVLTGVVYWSARRLARDESQYERLNEALEGRVQERTAQLEAINRELEAFSYSVSHDLRAPLHTIDGFSRLVLKDHADQLDAKATDYLYRVRGAAKVMGELIDALLQLSRIGRRELSRQPVDLSELARALAEEIRAREPKRAVEFHIENGVSASGDAALLRIALQNLLDNAWKFSAHGTNAVIEVGVQRTAGRAVYFVRDNGIGFDMAYADTLFQPFRRLHAPDEFPGTGIGLATVRRIIVRHGGQVWADACAGKGATFYFTL